MKKLLIINSVFFLMLVFSSCSNYLFVFSTSNKNVTKFEVEDSTKMLIIKKHDDKNELNGKYIKIHSNGNISVFGRYKNGNKEGVWKSYFSNGSKSSKVKYRNDTIVFQETYNLIW